ncbi:hypothetical protein D5E69_12545 [Rossellomorea marisflavi]|uniref:hypothetical protein n=1 Tax=Rossellomorea marisflavi TaxID=189381 RepID=UPI001318EB7B|nr:hypothetical protein [Rossellomorea marisflavi]QHA36567.1 hypothetical protein D5E69_12545 [Rossellomorea marisflavi]
MKKISIKLIVLGILVVFLIGLAWVKWMGSSGNGWLTIEEKYYPIDEKKAKGVKPVGKSTFLVPDVPLLSVTKQPMRSTATGTWIIGWGKR